MILRKITAFSLVALMCTTSPLAIKIARAQETQPGDACIAGETGAFRRAGDDTPGPAIEGQNFMFCDGSNWINFLRYDNPNANVILSAPSSAPANVIFSNSQWTLWLDEASNEFELKAKKSDGTFISATVGGGGGLWTDDTSYITYNSAHFINSGQTLPAALDDVGKRMFFYPDKAAFRGGEITGASTAWQEANIGLDSFSWGRNNTASGRYSVAMGEGNTASDYSTVAMGMSNTASDNYSVAMGYSNTASYRASVAMGYGNTASSWSSVAMGHANTASGYYSVAIGRDNTASDYYSMAMGFGNTASGRNSLSMGNQVSAGSGTGGDGAGDSSMAFGLQTMSQATDPKITGDRSAVFFFDKNISNANSTYDFTASDRLALVGGALQIGETQAQGAAAGCIRFESASNKLEYADDCSTYAAFSDGGGGLWTDDTYI